MPLPKFDAFMLPLLKLACDGQPNHLPDILPALAASMKLSDSEVGEMTSSGRSRFRDRTYWAKLYMSQAGLLKTTKPGEFVISDRGKSLLATTPDKIDVNTLLQYPEFHAFKNASKTNGSATIETKEASTAPETEDTPRDRIQSAINELRSAVVSELLESVREAHWSFLEKLILNLLQAMNYGGEGSTELTGGIGLHEGGIDGLIRKDKLGLGRIYVQAKRYKDGSNIGAPVVQQFVGSMKAKHAEEGVFVTTSSFTKEAISYVESLGNRIALINGQRLAELMYEYNLGVAVEETILIKSKLSDYFG